MQRSTNPRQSNDLVVLALRLHEDTELGII